MVALHKAAEKHKIVCLVGVIPENPDSYMFHTYNLHLLDAISSCLQMPIFKISTPGVKEIEVEDLQIQLELLRIDGIVIGGIESKYQRNRFKKVCENLDIELIAPLWHMDVIDLMEEVIREYNAIIVSVSAMGLDERFLGRKVDDKVLSELKTLNEIYGVHIAGEGGEYETLVLDAPLFRKEIIITNSRILWRGDSGNFEVTDFKLEEK